MRVCVCEGKGVSILGNLGRRVQHLRARREQPGERVFACVCACSCVCARFFPPPSSHLVQPYDIRVVEQLEQPDLLGQPLPLRRQHDARPVQALDRNHLAVAHPAGG